MDYVRQCTFFSFSFSFSFSLIFIFIYRQVVRPPMPGKSKKAALKATLKATFTYFKDVAKALPRMAKAKIRKVPQAKKAKERREVN